MITGDTWLNFIIFRLFEPNFLKEQKCPLFASHPATPSTLIPASSSPSPVRSTATLNWLRFGQLDRDAAVHLYRPMTENLLLQFLSFHLNLWIFYLG